MPPKPKFTREQIVAAALALVREKGMDALTARELGKRLGCSAQPIFTVFHSMEDVQDAVREAALGRFESYADRVPANLPAYMRLAMQMVLFAREEPRLYLLRFLPENRDGAVYGNMYSRMGIIFRHCLDDLQKDYSLSLQDAHTVFRHMWTYIFGVGTLCSTGAYDISADSFLENLERDFQSLMRLIHFAKNGEE